MITDNITSQIAEALKAKDEVKLSTLRMLSSALNYEYIAKQHKLSDEEEIVVVKREAKKRKDAIEAFRQAEGKLTESKIPLNERIKREEAEFEILKQFLPAEVSDETLTGWVGEAIAETRAVTIQDMGKVIGWVMNRAKGNADGAKVARMVKEKLTSDKPS